MGAKGKVRDSVFTLEVLPLLSPILYPGTQLIGGCDLQGAAPKPLLFDIAYALGEAFYSFPKCFSMLASGQCLPAATECVRVENIKKGSDRG